MLSWRFILLKKGTLYHLSWKKLDCLHLKDFLKYECELYSKQPSTPTQRKIIATHRTSNHRLAIENRQWPKLSLPLGILDYATFAPIMWLKTRQTLCWNVP